jgi:hypothetical protein
MQEIAKSFLTGAGTICVLALAWSVLGFLGGIARMFFDRKMPKYSDLEVLNLLNVLWGIPVVVLIVLLGAAIRAFLF